MILSDREILLALGRGAIHIEPAPKNERISSTAIDLCLDSDLRLWPTLDGQGAETVIDPLHPDFDVVGLTNERAIPFSCVAGFVLRPQMFVLGWTIERIVLPHETRLAGRVEGKSSLARIGVGVHVTAPTIHAGFGSTRKARQPVGSPIQLEIWNAGPLNVRLTWGMPICQLILEEVHGTPDKGYSGRFAVQGPSVALRPSNP